MPPAATRAPATGCVLAAARRTCRRAPPPRPRWPTWRAYPPGRRLTGYAAAARRDLQPLRRRPGLLRARTTPHAPTPLIRARHRDRRRGGLPGPHGKTHVQPPAASSVTGIVVNPEPGSPGEDYDRLRAVLHDALTQGRRGWANREGHPDFRRPPAGRVGWVESVNPVAGGRLDCRDTAGGHRSGRRASAGGIKSRHVPQHPSAEQLRAAGDQHRGPRRRPAVRPQDRRDDQAVEGQRRGLQPGRPRHRPRHRAPAGRPGVGSARRRTGGEAAKARARRPSAFASRGPTRAFPPPATRALSPATSPRSL